MISDLLNNRVWAMDLRALEAFAAQLAEIDLESTFAAQILALDVEGLAARQATPPTLQVRGGVASIPIRGIILKTVPYYFALYGIDATSTDDARRLLADALADETIERIHLDVDSPGGTIDGVQDLAEDIRAARGKKTITAHASDIAASAAYWIGSQAEKFTAGSSAAIGSIGVYTTLVDATQMGEDVGVKVHVVRSHELKGIGAGLGDVSEAQLAEVQRVINSYTAVFVDAVAAGREMERDSAAELATGQVWIGKDAKRKNLIDGIAREPASATTDTPQPAPFGATPKEPTMADEQAAALQGQIDDLTARLEATETKNAELEAANAIAEANAKAAKRDELLTRYRDRVPPAAIEQVKAYGDTVDAETFEGFLSAMPQVTRPEQIGSSPTGDEVDAPQPAALSDHEEEICKRLRISGDDFNRYGDAARITWDGKALNEKGEVIQ